MKKTRTKLSQKYPITKFYMISNLNLIINTIDIIVLNWSNKTQYELISNLNANEEKI